MTKHTKLYREATLTQVLIPAIYTTDQNSSSVDMKGFQDLTFLANIGNSGDTLSGTLYSLLEVEHSDDNSTWVDCTDAEITNPVAGVTTGTFAKIDDPAEDSLAIACAYKGSKRYVRCVYNVVGTHTNGTPVAITAIRSLASASA